MQQTVSRQPYWVKGSLLTKTVEKSTAKEKVAMMVAHANLEVLLKDLM